MLEVQCINYIIVRIPISDGTQQEVCHIILHATKMISIFLNQKTSIPLLKFSFSPYQPHKSRYK